MLNRQRDDDKRHCGQAGVEGPGREDTRLANNGVTASGSHSPAGSYASTTPAPVVPTTHRAGQGRHRPGLQRPQLAGGVNRPLDVLRPAVAVGHPTGQVRHHLRLPGRQHPARRGRRTGHGGVAGGDRPLLTDRFAGHQSLTQTGHRGDHHLVPVARDRMGGKRHAGRHGRASVAPGPPSQPQPRPLRLPGTPPPPAQLAPHHAIGMGGSYIALLTGFYVDNGPFLPLVEAAATCHLLAPAQHRRRTTHLARATPLPANPARTRPDGDPTAHRLDATPPIRATRAG
jgi:hypothetical protein